MSKDSELILNNVLGGRRMSKDSELILNNVLVALQLCLGVWQFTKLTPVGALIKCVVRWLLRPFELSETYSTLQIFEGRVFKKANCFVLQPEIPSARREGVELGSQDRLELHVRYLGKEFLLERRGSEENELFVDGKMCYYIIPTVWKQLWEELHVLENLTGLARATARLANRATAAADTATAAAISVAKAACDAAEAAYAAAAYYIDPDDYFWAHRISESIEPAIKAYGEAYDAAIDRAAIVAAHASISDAADAIVAAAIAARDVISPAAAMDITVAIAAAADTATAAAHTAKAAAAAAASASAYASAHDNMCRNFASAAGDLRTAVTAVLAAADAAPAAAVCRAGSVVLKGHREFWEEVSTGGIMSFDEVLDGLILHNQHLSLRLADNRLLPVDLSVSEEKLLKILNLFAVFLQTKKEKVHWLIPLLLSFISAILEFITPLRVWLYTKINVLFCSITHSMCDPLPRPWRQQVYSLDKWVGNLKPTNDIPLKIQRGNIRAIIAGVAKIDRQGASLVPWLNVVEEEHRRAVISDRFYCNSIRMHMTCTYFVRLNRCKIDAPTVSIFTVGCRSMEEYRRIITLVSCMANNGCGSLKSYGPHNKVSVRGFRESVLCYVKSGFPQVYELRLENVVLT